MRKILSAALLLTHFTLSAQLQKGTWTVSASSDAPPKFQFRTNSSHAKNYQFSLQPQFGYMLTDQLEAGAGLVFSAYGSSYKYGVPEVMTKNRNTELGAQVFTRYYLKKDGKLIPYLVASLQYSRTTVVNTNPPAASYRNHYNEWQLRGGAGLNWFAGPRVALFSELTYTGTWGSGYGLSHGVNLNFGVRLFLGKKRK